MKLTGLHLLLTFKCTSECDHCFVWGSPWQEGTMTVEQVRQILWQARSMDSLTSIYFEGGEPFLYYPVMVEGVRLAAEMGFQVGVVTNAFWADDEADALIWLTPLAGLIQDLSVSSDRYHGNEQYTQQAKNVCAAADQLGIPVGVISIAEAENGNSEGVTGQLPPGKSAVMFRGRAAEKLSGNASQHPWTDFDECPHEDLSEPGRVHVDPFGNMHLCQGISMGNLFQNPLKELCSSYTAQTHPIAGPLLADGPAELVRSYHLPHHENYADACHLCYSARLLLREKFPHILTPAQMYGEYNV